MVALQAVRHPVRCYDGDSPRLRLRSHFGSCSGSRAELKLSRGNQHDRGAKQNSTVEAKESTAEIMRKKQEESERTEAAAAEQQAAAGRRVVVLLYLSSCRSRGREHRHKAHAS